MIDRVRVSDGRPLLVGGRCDVCGHATFPYRSRCPACRAPAAMVETLLAPAGVVESAVEVHVSTDEWEAPYTLGLVRLEEGVTLLARIDGTDGPGAPVQLVADDSGRFWFRAIAHAHAPSANVAEERLTERGDRP